MSAPRLGMLSAVLLFMKVLPGIHALRVIPQEEQHHVSGLLEVEHDSNRSFLHAPGAWGSQIPVSNATAWPTKVTDAGAKAALAPPSTVSIAAFPIALLLAAGIIVFVYSPQGPRVVIGVTAYLLSLSTIKITVKLLFDEFLFKFPTFLTALHLACSAAVGFAVLLHRRASTGKDIIVPTRSEFVWGVLPITLSFGLSLMANNASLLSCSTSFNEIVSSTSPICTVAVVIAMGMPFDFRLLGPTLVVVLGCAVSASGEAKFSAIGFGLVMFANACRAVKGAMQQKLMTGQTQERFDPCTLLGWTCLCSCILLFAWSAVSEGLGPYAGVMQQRRRPLAFLAALAASCANAAVLNAAAIFVTKDLGAVGVTVVAQTRAVLTIVGGMAVFHDVVSIQEVLGFAVVMVGAYAYARTEQQVKAEQQVKGGAFVDSPAAKATFIAQAAAEAVTPTTPAPTEAAFVTEERTLAETCRL